MSASPSDPSFAARAARPRLAARCATAALVVTALSSRAAPAADETTGPAPLATSDTETVVVTATRSAADPFELPFTTHAVGEERMSDERSIRSFPDALSEIPGIYLQRSSYGQASPYLRGFTGFRTLLLIDGIRLNNSVFREGPNQYWSTVDPLTVERVEAVLGPGSVLYGSDAIGGTVNAITRSPDRSAEAPAAAPGAYGRYASAEGSATLRGELGGAPLTGLGVLGGVSWRDFDDLVAGRGTGELPGTAYDELDGDAKLVYGLRDDLDLVLGWQRVFQDDVPRTHATVDAISFRGTTIGSDRRRDTDQERQLGYAQARYAPRGEWLHDATLSLSYQLQSETELRVRGSGAREIQDLDVGTVGLWTQATSPVPFGTLTYGAEWYHDDVESSFTTQDASGSPTGEARRGAVADDSRYDLVGVYVQDIIPLGDTFETHVGGRWNLARVDAADVDPDTTDAIELGPVEESYSALVGSLRGVWRVAEGWRLFAGASQGFRAPNLSDLTRFEVNAASGEFEVPAPDLDPEEYVSLEGGARYAGGRLEAWASYYYTFIEGLIVRFPTGREVDGGPEFSKANVGDGYVNGVELGSRVRVLDDVSLYGSFAWVEGTADSIVDGRQVREALSRIQPPWALVGARWDSSDGRWWGELEATFAGDADRLAARDVADTQRIPPGGTPGYEVLALRAGGEVVSGLDVGLAVENVTNQDYRLHGSGVNEPGTNAIVTLDYRL